MTDEQRERIQRADRFADGVCFSINASERQRRADMEAVMREAFQTGRLFALNGERESWIEIEAKLRENCRKAVNLARSERPGDFGP